MTPMVMDTDCDCAPRFYVILLIMRSYIGIKRIHTSPFKKIFATDVMFVTVYCAWYKVAAQLSSSLGRF